MTTHSIVHIEFPAAETAQSTEFYSKLFGWQVQHHPEMSYPTFAVEGGVGGGFPQVDGEMVQPGNVLVYVSTDDIEASLARVEELGGQTVVPRTDIPGIGFFAIFRDPTGNRVALYSER